MKLIEDKILSYKQFNFSKLKYIYGSKTNICIAAQIEGLINNNDGGEF